MLNCEINRRSNAQSTGSGSHSLLHLYVWCSKSEWILDLPLVASEHIHLNSRKSFLKNVWREKLNRRCTVELYVDNWYPSIYDLHLINNNRAFSWHDAPTPPFSLGYSLVLFSQFFYFIFARGKLVNVSRQCRIWVAANV